MNKYSSKAIKTAATVGMSLAMVLSNVAPVLAVGEPAGVCATGGANDTAECGRDLYLRISDALADDGIEFADVQMDTGVTITIDNNAEGATVDLEDQDIIRTIYTYRTALSTYRTSSSTSTAIYREIGTWLTAVDQIAEKMGIFTNLDAEDATEVDVADLEGTVQGYASEIDTEGQGWLDTDGEITASASITAAKAALSAMNTFENRGYYNYMSDVMQDYFSSVKSNIEIALGDNIETSDEQMVAFVEAFDKILQNDLDGDPTMLTVDEQKITGHLDGSAATGEKSLAAVNLSSRSALRARINKIQNADLYDDLENEEAVIAIIDAYQELLDNLGDLSTILTSDAYVTYTRTKTDDADETVRSYVLGESSAKFGDVAINTAAKALAEVKKIAAGLDSEQWAVLADLKADVLDLVFNFSTRQIGNYYTDRGAFVDNATASQKSTITANVPGALLKVVDTETGEFGIDYLASYMEDVADALAAVTTDIEALTPTNIKASDKALLEAAEDALFDLQYEGKYAGNLTTDQAREVRRAVSKITNLREAFDNLGVTNVAGWYSMGNGNWGYNNEDGTPAAYKWVASGADWYMIKDGKMLRNTWIATDGGRWYYVDNAGKMVTNQSVDGCWINSYGVYMSPSYNG